MAEISTHAPLAGRDQYLGCTVSDLLGEFQPTRPLRGATADVSSAVSAAPNFNPRAPCGARRERSGLSDQ